MNIEPVEWLLSQLPTLSELQAYDLADGVAKRLSKTTEAKLREQSAREHAAWEVLRKNPRWSLETTVTGRQWAVTDESFPVSPPLSRADDPVDAVLAVVEAAKQEARHDAGGGQGHERGTNHVEP